jgi:hypothetical protein
VVERIRVGYIDCPSNGSPTGSVDCVCSFLRSATVQIADSNRSAPLDQHVGDSDADSAPSPGDECDLVL